MQYPDMRTVFIMAIVLTSLIAICFFALWLQHRKTFKGIGLFTGVLFFTSVGYFAIGSQNILHSCFSVVLGNVFVSLSLTMAHHAFRLFLYKNYRYNFFFYLIPFAVVTEQIVFTNFYPSLQIRIIAVSVIFSIQFLLILSSIILSKRSRTLPGIILITCYVVLTAIFIIRIPAAMNINNNEVLISAGKVQAFLSFIGIVTRLITPIGLILLVTQELQFIEQKRVTEKEHILKEVHHRIKNNMQTMKSILILKAAVSEPEVEQALCDASERLTSMMILYDRLYRKENLEKISTRDFLLPLIDEIIEIFPLSVSVEKDIDDLPLPVNTASYLGIIINELITNSMKYAFTDKQKSNRLSISLKKKNNHVEIILQDNGSGFNREKSVEGFGLELCQTLALQIGGTFSVDQNSGTRNTIRFPVSGEV